MRKLIKTTGANFLSRTGATALMRYWSDWRHNPLVLGYHRVVEDFTRESRCSIPAQLITRDMLEKHLDWIGRRSDFLSLEGVCTRLESAEPFSRPAALVTFDDGYQDVYDHALPLLRRKGIPAAVFVVTQLLDTDRPQIHDELYLLLSDAISNWHDPAGEFARLLSRLGILNPDESTLRGFFSLGPFALTTRILDLLGHNDVKRLVEACAGKAAGGRPGAEGLRAMKWHMLDEMRRAGFTIGSHTDSHPLLTNEPMQDVYQELMKSRLALETRLGTPVTCIAYPDGRFDGEVVKAAHSCGYRFGFSTCTHLDPQHPLLTIPRRVLWEKSCVDFNGRFDAAVMDCQITGLFDFMAPCTQNHSNAAVLPGLRKVRAHASLESS